jgi:hypothetical protein
MCKKIDPKPVHKFMRENNGVLSNNDMAEKLGVSLAYITQQRLVIGLKAFRVNSDAPKPEPGEAARREMKKQSLGGELSLSWLSKPFTAEGAAQ